jgi:uncharacterized protein (TIGR03437 family)
MFATQYRSLRLATIELLIGVVSAQPSSKPFSVLSPAVTTLQSAAVSDFVAGDFNGDGRTDVAMLSYAITSSGTLANPPATNLSVFIGNGDGSYRPGSVVATYVSTGGYLNVGDFNGDGKLDLVVMTGETLATGVLVIYLGHGDGTFAGAIQYPTALAPLQRIFVADINKDGKPDLVCGGPFNSGAGAVLIGNGDGTFQPPILLPLIAQIVADVNRDGNFDIIGAIPGGGALTILLGRGDGTFGSGSPIGPIQFASTQVGSYQSIASGDFNGDGNVDLAVSQQPGGQVGAPQPVNMVVLFGNGDGTFQSPKVFTGPGGPLLAVDLNQDGKLDLVSNYGVLLGNGDGTFNPPLYLSTPSYGCAIMAGTQIIPNGCGTYSRLSIAGDLNGDGMPDLITAGVQPLAQPASMTSSTTWLLSSFVNDSPGDGFLATGVSSTGGTGQTIAYPPGAPFGTQPISEATGPGFAIGQNSLVTAYGVNLAPSTASAAGPPYPTNLGGISLHLGDSLAQLLYVSPTQINYLASPGPFLGTFGSLYGAIFANPTVSIERAGATFLQKGLVLPMVPNAPGLFSVDASGIAAATAVRVAPDGTQTTVSVFDCSTSPCRAVPIDLSGDPVYLSLYGTGFDFSSTQGLPPALSCTGGQTVYFGPQGVVPGLDQINLLLGKTNSGNLAISCRLYRSEPVVTYMIDVVSNAVQISIK